MCSSGLAAWFGESWGVGEGEFSVMAGAAFVRGSGINLTSGAGVGEAEAMGSSGIGLSAGISSSTKSGGGELDSEVGLFWFVFWDEKLGVEGCSVIPRSARSEA